MEQEQRPAEKRGRTVIEEIEVAGNQLVDRVKDILKEGNVRQLRIRAADGDIVLETPLNIGVIAGGAVALAAPWLAVLGVLAALVARLRIEVERESAEPQAKPAEEQKSSTKDAA